MSLFPSIPDVPGVPAILRDPSAILSGNVTRLVTDLIDYAVGAQWGIYLFGVPVVLADNVVSMSYTQNWSLSDFPLERGAFESYDKVNTPFDVHLRFSTGGTLTDRQLMLTGIQVISDSLLTYDIITPEAVYPSVNITGYTYHRSADVGAGLLTVDITAKEVRIASTSLLGLLGNVLGISASPLLNSGTLQGLVPDLSTVSSFLSSPFS
jgi:hypothetical protein